MWWFILGVFILVIVIAVFIVYSISQRKKAMLDTLTSLPGFEASQSYMGEDGNSGVAIDDINRKICLINYDGDNIKTRIISYRDVLSTELLVDGNELVRTSRTSQIGGAILGGIIAGGVGAIIGGLSGSKTSTQKVKNISLLVVVNDSSEPTHLINFLDSECKKDSFLYRNSIGQARHWQSLISVLIKQADEEDKKNAINNSEVFSSADEIYKLSELLKQGIISQDEFDKQKAKLLGL